MENNILDEELIQADCNENEKEISQLKENLQVNNN